MKNELLFKIKIWKW